MEVIFEPVAPAKASIGFAALFLAGYSTYSSLEAVRESGYSRVAAAVAPVVGLAALVYLGRAGVFGEGFFLALSFYDVGVSVSVGLLVGALAALMPSALSAGGGRGGSLGVGAAFVGIVGCCGGPVLAAVASLGGWYLAGAMSTYAPAVVLVSLVLMSYSVLELAEGCASC